MSHIELSVVLPCYNEAPRIRATVAQTVAVLHRILGPEGYEIIPVDDGSADATWSVLQHISQEFEAVTPLLHKKNQGKGMAIRTGVMAATGRYIAFLDADGQISPQHLAWYLLQAKSGPDIIIGSKVHAQSQTDTTPTRRALSTLCQMVHHALFGLPVADTQVGIKLFTRDVAQNVFPMLSSYGYAFDIELLWYSHRLGYKIEEAPVRITARDGSSVGLRGMIKMLKEMMKLRRKGVPTSAQRYAIYSESGAL